MSRNELAAALRTTRIVTPVSHLERASCCGDSPWVVVVTDGDERCYQRGIVTRTEADDMIKSAHELAAELSA